MELPEIEEKDEKQTRKLFIKSKQQYSMQSCMENL